MNREEPGVRSRLAEGQAALRRGAWGAARDAFGEVLSDGENGVALEGLASAFLWLDQADAALEARERAFRIYRERGDQPSAGRAALGLAVDCLDFRGLGEARSWLERAAEILGGVETSVEHGWLALWQGHVTLLDDRDAKAARGHAEEAGRIAAAHSVPELARLAEALEGLVLVAEGAVGEGIRRVDDAATAALAGDVAALDAVSATCCFLIHACERVRDYDRVARWTDRVERFSREWGIVPALTVCRTQHAAMLIGRGKWREAEAELQRATERLQQSRPLLAAEGLEQLAELRRRQGRWDEALSLFAQAEGRSLALLGRALIAQDRGDARDAADLLERFLRRTPPDNWTGRASALEALVRVRLALGQRDEAVSAQSALDTLAARIATPMIRAAALVGRAALQLAAEECDAARCGLEDAVDLLLGVQAPFEAARTRLELSACLARLGRSGPARQEARSALECFQRLGAARDCVRAEARVASLEGPPETAARTRGTTADSDRAAGKGRAVGLTDREIEVLRLVAGGLADKEIAERLFLSQHTVHRHVSNIRTKLGLPSRAAAVGWAAQNGLL